ncbi:nucleic-acid-binding protein from mobile element jockey [Lasius niger]|uniref:Nucleic-acid-binding protein from mobile element jockey n=1 Tax=Lasius niger TaxID=67767 RepID=A0A0J7MUP4_LASNI|nr:nucleic-acid-binding protein from mobile element jockey [Lasius niger]
MQGHRVEEAIEIDSNSKEGNEIDKNKQGSREIEDRIEKEINNTVLKKKGNKVKMIINKDRLRYEEEIGDKDREILENRNYRFKSGHRGEIMVKANVDSKYSLKSRAHNAIKIASLIYRIGIKIEKIRNIGFSRSIIYCKNIVEANRCLDLGKGTEEQQIHFSIPNRVKRCKGVITEWELEMPLHELIEAMEDTSGIMQIERMKRRFRDAKSGEYKTDFTHHILITMEGNELPKEFRIFGGSVAIRVRPYIEPVKQCYQCFRFGHIQSVCKAEKKCINCGNQYHGRCEKEATCANCGEDHKPTNKRCAIYDYNYQLKRVMAERKISLQEAKNFIRRESNREVIHYGNLKEWPELNHNEPDRRQNELRNGRTEMGKKNYSAAIKANKEEKQKEDSRKGQDDKLSRIQETIIEEREDIRRNSERRN